MPTINPITGEIMAGIIDPFVTLLAAFAGAWFAFRFERQHKEKEAEDRCVAAGQRAIYTIFNIWNIQEQYRKEIIEAYRGKEDAWLNMSATPTYPGGLTTFEVGELTFLLEKHAGSYTDMLLEEQRFALAMQLIDRRSHIILEDAWPRLAAAGIDVGESVDTDHMKKTLGMAIVQELQILTPAIVKNIDENLLSLVAVYNDLRSALKSCFPKRKFIRVEFELAAEGKKP